ncbi:putative phytanoyl- dioxygenase family protein [Rosellinia necatrix]|uniref:Putative phytanoyl-dioxygenase family protein n=1 Tax=Rosellinia necatrix TaxID=77044 RepID=A0A1S8A7N9_ROSNE|nr:putative phytanoyl- dioxygenase family protein [Rosellinia necatrix]
MGSVTNEITVDQYPEVMSHFKEHGWAIVPSVISKAKSTSILDRLWEVAAVQETRGYAQFNPFMDPNASNVRIWYQPEIHNIFSELSFQ